MVQLLALRWTSSIPVSVQIQRKTDEYSYGKKQHCHINPLEPSGNYMHYLL
jgi:hypothetical protein